MKIPENLEERLTNWTREILRRADQGRKEYGDKSFSRDPLELIEEVRQELRDVSVWAFITDCVLEDCHGAISRHRAETLASLKRKRETIDGFCAQLERVRIHGLEEVAAPPVEAGS